MYLLRHCESFFNLHFKRDRRDPGIEDPELTPAGHEHARHVAQELASRGIERLIISPYTRTLQTAGYILERAPVPAHVAHEVRERTAFVCDIGSHPQDLARRFPHHDFSHLPARWWHERTETAEETIARAGRFRRQVMNSEAHSGTLVVTHWAFILALTGRSVANGEWVQFDPHAPPPDHIEWKV